jgi:hypothetical protein
VSRLERGPGKARRWSVYFCSGAPLWASYFCQFEAISRQRVKSTLFFALRYYFNTNLLARPFQRVFFLASNNIGVSKVMTMRQMD